MNRKLSLEERIHRAQGTQAIENVKSNHAYLHACGYNYEEFTQFWNKSEDATWAHGFGRMVGYKEVYRGQVLDLDVKEYSRFPEWVAAYYEMAGHNARSVGTAAVHALASAVIEVADDGKTGRSSYLTPGTMMSRVNPGKVRRSNILWERYGSDFVYEDGDWVYFHEQVCPDMDTSYDKGSNWARKYFELAVKGEDTPGFSSQHPDFISETDLSLRHRECTLSQIVQNRAPWPEPYAKMDDENTYSPGRLNPNNYPED